jgi:SAM-dependent methyltransferase
MRTFLAIVMTLTTAAATTVDGKVDFFGQGDQAKMYSEFRPTYTPEVVAEILARVPEEARGLYVDIACGSGQLTKLIAPHFEKAIGIDQSYEQLNNVRADSNIEYRVGSVFELPFENNSVDLVTVAQAFHWFVPFERALAEITRVLKPNGVFVTVGYGFPLILEPSPAMALANHFYLEILGGRKPMGSPGCWWDTDRALIDAHYAGIEFPYPDTVVRRSMPFRTTITVSHYCNYLRTYSAYRTMMRSSGASDPMPGIEAEIIRLAPDGNLEIEIPFFSVSFVKH